LYFHDVVSSANLHIFYHYAAHSRKDFLTSYEKAQGVSVAVRLQKATFHAAKGLELHSKRPPFAMQKTAF